MKVSFNLQTICSLEELPSSVRKTIFLAGPCPRNDASLSWHPEALSILEGLGYDGAVIVPMYRDGKNVEFDLEAQTQWEQKMMDAADCIVFWVPRKFRPDFEMIGLTTNVEFGRYFATGKCVAGAPLDAEKTEYLKVISKDTVKWHDTLEDTLEAAVDFVGDGVYREGVETTVPQHIFVSEQFQNWYGFLKKAGNRLENFRMLYNFFMPIQKKLFLAIWKPSVFISDENRTKEIEFVVGRTDISHILAYYPAEDMMSSKIVLVEEFRSPVANANGKVFELPGGSSLKPNVSPNVTARDELEEETGLSVSPDRFSMVAAKQSAATLCSHRAWLFCIELTEDEISSLEQDDSVHGNVEDTERTYVHVVSVREALSVMDWTNSGMVLQGLSAVFRS